MRDDAHASLKSHSWSCHIQIGNNKIYKIIALLNKYVIENKSLNVNYTG
jgi:hypothetical protein